MDTLVLQRLTAELDVKLRGTRIRQVYALPKNDVIFVCGSGKTLRLWFSAAPNQPHLYLRPGRYPTPKQPPGFALAARRLLNGRRIEAIRTVPGERIVELHTTGTDAIRVVFELIPRRATALVVNHTERVCAAWKPHMPCTPPPGGVLALQRTIRGMGVAFGIKLGTGRENSCHRFTEPPVMSPPTLLGL